MYMPAGYPKTTAVTQPAFDAIFIGDQKAADALPAAVAEANAILEQEMSRS
jgi:ABC-type glycerol-3-phosphate transport system substrate-binding protein